jgi:hypothetical protein
MRARKSARSDAFVSLIILFVRIFEAPLYRYQRRLGTPDTTLEILQGLEQVKVLHTLPQLRLLAPPPFSGKKKIEFGVGAQSSDHDFNRLVLGA